MRLRGFTRSPLRRLKAALAVLPGNSISYPPWAGGGNSGDNNSFADRVRAFPYLYSFAPGFGIAESKAGRGRGRCVKFAANPPNWRRLSFRYVCVPAFTFFQVAAVPALGMFVRIRSVIAMKIHAITVEITFADGGGAFFPEGHCCLFIYTL